MFNKRKTQAKQLYKPTSFSLTTQPQQLTVYLSSDYTFLPSQCTQSLLVFYLWQTNMSSLLVFRLWQMHNYVEISTGVLSMANPCHLYCCSICGKQALRNMLHLYQAKLQSIFVINFLLPFSAWFLLCYFFCYFFHLFFTFSLTLKLLFKRLCILHTKQSAFSLSTFVQISFRLYTNLYKYYRKKRRHWAKAQIIPWLSCKWCHFLKIYLLIYRREEFFKAGAWPIIWE